MKEAMQHLWCQHCKAMQKTNNTIVECLYNPLDHGREKAFCASNIDAVTHFLALLPKGDDEGILSPEETSKYVKYQTAGYGDVVLDEEVWDIDGLKKAQAALTKRLERERIIKWIDARPVFIQSNSLGIKVPIAVDKEWQSFKEQK